MSITGVHRLERGPRQHIPAAGAVDDRRPHHTQDEADDDSRSSQQQRGGSAPDARRRRGWRPVQADGARWTRRGSRAPTSARGAGAAGWDWSPSLSCGAIPVPDVRGRRGDGLAARVACRGDDRAQLVELALAGRAGGEVRLVAGGRRLAEGAQGQGVGLTVRHRPPPTGCAAVRESGGCGSSRSRAASSAHSRSAYGSGPRGRPARGSAAAVGRAGPARQR